MKRGVMIIMLLVLSALAAALVSATEFRECAYDEDYDLDGDYIMNKDADCGSSYQYDCDDSNKDIYKDCAKPFWTRLIEWLKGEDNQVKQKIENANLITGNTIKKIVPQQLPKIISASDEEEEAGSEESGSGSVSSSPSCSVNICYNSNMKEIYCPLDYSDCCEKYSNCRTVYCEDDSCVQEEEIVYTSADEDTEECDEEYHDCYDNGEAVVCKGDFTSCAMSFDNCVCGTSGSGSIGEQLQPDIDASEDVNCSTGVYVCDRQQLTMSGDLASSTVTCKSSFSACSMLYGNCRCGNSTLTDFPTQYIGSANKQTENAQNYWCDYKGDQIPCYMLPGNCTKKTNTCKNSKGNWINCEGKFDYCQKQYGECLCGVENIGTGILKTS